MANATLVKDGRDAELYLEGRIDASSVLELEKILLNVGERFDNVTLDFQKVPFISSAGLRSLLKLYKLMRQKGGSFHLRNVNDNVMEIFRLTGFTRLLEP